MPEPLNTHRPDTSRHAISVLIMTAAVVLNAVVLCRASSQRLDWADVELRVLLGVVFGQVTLAAAYFGLGNWNIAYRSIVLLLGAVASSLLTAAMLTNRPWLYFIVHLTAALVTGVILLGCRCLGLRLTHADIPEVKVRLQFTLLDAMSLMTAVGIVAAAYRWTEWPTGMWREVSNWIILGATTGLCSMTALLLGSNWWRGVLVGVLAIIVESVLLHWLLGFYDDWWIPTILAQFSLVAACCVVLQLAGYRSKWLSPWRR